MTILLVVLVYAVVAIGVAYWATRWRREFDGTDITLMSLGWPALVPLILLLWMIECVKLVAKRHREGK